MSDVGEILMQQQQISVGFPFGAEGRPAWIAQPRRCRRSTQASQRRLTQPDPDKNPVFMQRKCAYPGTNRNFALGGYIDAETVSVVGKTGVAGNNPVAIDATQAQGIGPVCAPIFQSDRGSVGDTKEPTPVPRTRRPSGLGQPPRWWRRRTNSYADESRSDKWGSRIAGSWISHLLHKSRVSRGDRQRDTQTHHVLVHGLLLLVEHRIR